MSKTSNPFKFSFLFIILQFSSFFLSAQDVNVSGTVKSAKDNSALQFVNVTATTLDSVFVTGTITNETGSFTLAGLRQGRYLVRLSFVGFEDQYTEVTAGRLNRFLDLGTIFMRESATELGDVLVIGKREEVATALDRRTFSIDENISQLGGSALQAMQNLPGVTIDRDGKIFLRGSDKIAILIEGKQTAFTGMGAQSGLDNIPASAIESIEIITNPSARFDATGNAGIINIIFKKEQQYGWNGKLGFVAGIGALGIKEPNMPGIRDQYQFTPKWNPSLALNYKKNKLNWFFQGDLLHQTVLMKNEFIQRVYDNGEVINQQFLENRTQPIYNINTGLDWEMNKRNDFTFGVLFNYRAYTDLGDLPFDNAINRERVRLWEYYEDEVNQTLFINLTHTHSFPQAGHQLKTNFNYSFRRKDEVFYFTNTLPNMVGTDTTMLVADENIFDLNIDYTKPLKSGRIEFGTKQRARIFPNDITFIPGINSILDLGLAGTAEYREWLSAAYGNYIYERPKFELEAGLRVEYAKIDYLVDPNHAVYNSDGFDYFEPFPSVRATWFVSDLSNFSFFYNRRVDRPEESALRVFPTYANPEILSIGNPMLEPQFTNSVELGYKKSWDSGYIFGSVYYRATNNLLTRIITEVPLTNRLTSISQNAGLGINTGLEMVFSQKLAKNLTFNLNANGYQNIIDAFEIVNAYPSNINFSREREEIFSGNVKTNFVWNLPKQMNFQFTATYLAPDLLPQGKILSRYYADLGVTKKIQNGKGELLLNASDIFNTLVVRQEIQGTDFQLISDDYYETQVFRLGYNYRF
jgi:outer membrane receptor protein involved in Fe transport